MPRNSSGDYSAPVNSWNPPVTGTIISPTDWIAQLADYDDAFTDSLSRTGQGGMLADLEVNDNAILMEEIAAPSAPAANSLLLYALESSGTKLAYKDSGGTQTILGGGGTGDVVGPASATDNAVARFDSTTGKLVQNSAVTIADTTGLIAGSRFANGGLQIEDTNASHLLIITPGSDLTANRIFTLTTGDAARTLTISGDHTLIAGTSAVLAGAQTLTGGFKATPFAAGTKSSGTYTPLYSDGNFQTATNGGAHTLAPPADDCTIIVQYTNNGSAGSITTSGFTKVTGSFTTTNGDDFFAYITKIGSFSALDIKALQ